MSSLFIKVSKDDQDPKKDVSSADAPKTEDITAEKVYKSFKEWKRLGKQDATEPPLSSKEDAPTETKKTGGNK